MNLIETSPKMLFKKIVLQYRKLSYAIHPSNYFIMKFILNNNDVNEII